MWEFNPGAVLTQERERTRPTHEVAFFAFSVQATGISPLEGKIANWAKTSLKWLLFFFNFFPRVGLEHSSSQVEQKFIVEPLRTSWDVARSEPKHKNSGNAMPAMPSLPILPALICDGRHYTARSHCWHKYWKRWKRFSEFDWPRGKVRLFRKPHPCWAALIGEVCPVLVPWHPKIKESSLSFQSIRIAIVLDPPCCGTHRETSARKWRLEQAKLEQAFQKVE